MDKISLLIVDRRNINLRIKKENNNKIVKTLENDIQEMLGYPSDKFNVISSNNYDTVSNIIKNNGLDFILFYKLKESNVHVSDLIKLNKTSFKIIAYNKRDANFQNIQQKRYTTDTENILGKVRLLTINEGIRNITFCEEVHQDIIKPLILNINKSKEVYYNKNFFYNGKEIVEIINENNIALVYNGFKRFLERIFR